MLMEDQIKTSSTSMTRTYFQGLGAICRKGGHRFGEHIERVMPLVMQYNRQEEHELKEHVLQVRMVLDI